MELLRTNKSLIYSFITFLGILLCWLLLSSLDNGQAQDHLIEKESLRLQVYIQEK